MNNGLMTPCEKVAGLKTRIAYIVGIGGSGKTTIVEQFRECGHVVNADHLQGEAGQRLSPFARRESIWEWGHWENLLQYCDAAAALRLSLISQFPQNLADGRPILAEGAILALEPWKQAFAEALRQIGLQLDQEEYFWLDPPVETLHRNVLARGRDHEQHWDAKTMADLKSWFARRVGYLEHRRFEQPAELSDRLREFLELEES